MGRRHDVVVKGFKVFKSLVFCGASHLAAVCSRNTEVAIVGLLKVTSALQSGRPCHMTPHSS